MDMDASTLMQRGTWQLALKKEPFVQAHVLFAKCRPPPPPLNTRQHIWRKVLSIIIAGIHIRLTMVLLVVVRISNIHICNIHHDYWCVMSPRILYTLFTYRLFRAAAYHILHPGHRSPHHPLSPTLRRNPTLPLWFDGRSPSF
jgi:hypothetical protein